VTSAEIKKDDQRQVNCTEPESTDSDRNETDLNSLQTAGGQLKQEETVDPGRDFWTIHLVEEVEPESPVTLSSNNMSSA
jgi:hypothetical protein